jgi:hypothetical protein
MKRILGLLGLVLLLPSCANNVTGAKLPPVWIFDFSVAGQIAKQSDVNYYLVVNASTNQNEGPTANGPVPEAKPAPWWNLPFMRDLDIVPGEAASLRESYWTDFFRLNFDSGSATMQHGKWPNPAEKTKSPTVLVDVGNLQQGNEWELLNNNTVRLKIPFTMLGIASESILNEDMRPTITQINANLIVARDDGTVIDHYQIDPNVYFTVRTSGNIDTSINSFPVKNPSSIPGGISQTDVDLSGYRSEVKILQ